MAIVLPLNGRYVLSPDFISALISFARSKILKIVALSKSLMCRKSFRPFPLTEDEGEEVAAKLAWQETRRRIDGKLTGETPVSRRD